jgi:hypothetical protein
MHQTSHGVYLSISLKGRDRGNLGRWSKSAINSQATRMINERLASSLALNA